MNLVPVWNISEKQNIEFGKSMGDIFARKL
jgi:hypothetical protein